VPQLHVLEAVPLLRQGAQRLRQQLPLGHLDALLAPPRAHDLAFNAYDVADVQPVQPCISRLAHGVHAAEQLDAPAVVLQIHEGDPALAADGAQPARYPHRRSFQITKAVQHRVDGVRAIEAAAVRGHALLQQPPTLVHAHRNQIVDVDGLLVRHQRVTSRISYFSTPSGACTSTMVPGVLPIMACPTGDSLEMRLLSGSASAEPTTKYSNSSPNSRSLSRTREPSPTTPSSFSDVSISLAFRRVFSSCKILPSRKACSFFASSYSEFSEMSPNSKACLMRSATSRRRTVLSRSSSRSSLARPSGVSNTSFSRIERGLPLAPGVVCPLLYARLT